jgi:hypothetical protein
MLIQRKGARNCIWDAMLGKEPQHLPVEALRGIELGFHR